MAAMSCWCYRHTQRVLLEREREDLFGVRKRERVLGGRGTERLMIERQELVETGGGHMGGGALSHTPQLIVA